ncbi:EAL and HDOD domain-containing protein [Oceanimonas doudoroffii]|uniref:Diguanylate phosphodiesterase n=1 Tax=Oceanimonas doudoroffii TaxID=84158 RepID=A0A233RFE2_9GAMM|nr:EAL domain-containing protein [Oceanimonas doudoroffii]OXY82094.1 diguanylate phosphodiesterase [Oceanimonas doudoroffii]
MENYSFVAKQAILDVHGKPLGYELLFRQGLDNRFPNIGAEQATRRLMAEQFLSQKIEDLVGPAMCFVNFPDTLLHEGLAESFRHYNIVIEILEDATPTPQLLACVQDLKAMGMKVALDDHIPHEAWHDFFPYLDFIKLDLRELPLEECKRLINTCRPHTSLQFIAEKVETREEFEAARKLGFQYFQGYYFQQPQVVQRRLLTTDERTAFDLMAAVTESTVDYDRVTELFMRDLPLTYNLLRYINNQHLGYKASGIDKLRSALVYLGQKQLKQFTAMVMTAYISKGKSQELYRHAMIRARWCELMATNIKPELAEDAFLCGLFSLLDVLLDQTMEEVLPNLTVSEQVQQALLERKGTLGFLLGVVHDHERANWSLLQKRLNFIDMDQHTSARCYEEAVHWSLALDAEGD